MQSIWFESVPDEKRFPALQGNLRSDVVIIGGGIAGVCAAYFLNKAGRSVALLETATLGSGDSGLTTAFATHFLDDLEATKKAWGASDEAIGLFKNIISEEGIDADWEDVSTLGFTNLERDGLHEKYDELKSLDETLSFLEDSEAQSVLGSHVRAAIYKKSGEGQFHIRKFIRGVADSASKRGAQFFEESEALEIKFGEEVTVRTDHGSIVARRLIVAAGPPPMHLFPAVSHLVSGNITYVIQAEYEKALDLRRALFWDDTEPFHYFRLVGERTVILGGEDRALRGPRPEKNPHEALTNWLMEFSDGASFKVANKWQGTVYYTRDFLPYVGPHKDYGENVIFLTGWGGNGMTFGVLASKIAADIVKGRENPHAQAFSLNR